MTDNFRLFEDYVYVSTPNRGRTINDDPDKYWVVEIISRGKDREGPGQNIHFKNYYINKISDLYKYEREIKTLCDALKSRAYISVNYKSYKQVTLNACAAMANRIAKHDFINTYKIWESCSGEYADSSNKRYVLDFDCKDLDENVIEDILKTIRPEGSKVFAKFPTRSGFHLITTPFDIIEFNKKWNETFEQQYAPSIQVNNLILLYENLD